MIVISVHQGRGLHVLQGLHVLRALLHAQGARPGNGHEIEIDELDTHETVVDLSCLLSRLASVLNFA